jgi:PPOX class probable FMN-dependent enzyme
MDVPGRIENLEQLEALYRQPSERAVDKQFSSIDQGMAAFIDRSPFVVLATTDANGSVDASPRGGPPGFVRILDDRHIAIPDLNGNNRLDSYRNLIEHPYAGVLMIVPGQDETLRVNGPAVLSTDPALLAGFTNELRTPKMTVVIETAEIYGHCAKAFRRGAVWQPEAWSAIDRAPDLAAMYACTWGVEEDAMRSILETTYADDLSLD